MSGWRLAYSLQALEREIQSTYPGTTVWDIGDQNHASGDSDHNPNDSAVVCAIDVLGDKGLSLASFAEALRTSGHPQLKYVIFNRRICSRKNGWKWVAYNGASPHDHHCHVSVGTGSDGHSAPGSYDSTVTWGVVGNSEHNMGDDMIGLTRGDSGEEVKALQYVLVDAGFSPGTVDGEYGSATANALLACRKSTGSAATDGNTVTAAAYAQLLRVLIRKQSSAVAVPGPAGPRGATGATGPAGKNGTNGVDGKVQLPVNVTITALNNA